MKNSRSSLTVVLGFFVLSLAQASSEHTSLEKAPLVLGQGEQRLLHLPGLERYSLGSPKVRAIRPARGSASELLLKGVAPGTGDLWVWKKDGSAEHRSIHVEKVLPEELPPNLARALGDLQETEVLLMGSSVVLRGIVRLPSEAARVAALVRAFPKEVHDETDIDEALLQKGGDSIRRWIEASGYSKRLTLETSAGRLWVRGAIDRPQERARVEAKLRSLFPLVETEVGSLPDEAPTVHFRVFLLELKKSRFRTLGISWPGSSSAFSVTTTALRDMFQLDTTLEALEGDGSAKILSSPELVVRAPGEAELFSGGELPLEMKTHFFSEVVWKNYGLTLKLNVTQATDEKARLDIFTEVSHLDSDISVGKLPAIRANRMKTQVDARFGVPLLLSGLLQHGIREEAKGLPLLRSIPILGQLFGSEDYLNERSELVAILLPQKTPPEAPTERVARLAPKGFTPIPSNWMTPSNERDLRESPDYPWNVLE
jgi:Flp pilus assembly secretin CpaC